MAELRTDSEEMKLTDAQRAILDHASFMAEWFGIFPFRASGQSKDALISRGYLERIISKAGNAYYRITPKGRAALQSEGAKP
jgi:hypothetical protein